MSTRSFIAMQTGKDEYKVIYCHWDGYPEYNGKMLLEHYSDRNKLNELLELGDISSLKEKAAPDNDLPHSFDSPQEDVTVAYHRDRGKKLNPASTWTKTQMRKQANNAWVEFIYIYTLENKWMFIDVCHKGSRATSIQNYFKAHSQKEG